MGMRIGWLQSVRSTEEKQENVGGGDFMINYHLGICQLNSRFSGFHLLKVISAFPFNIVFLFPCVILILQLHRGNRFNLLLRGWWYSINCGLFK